MNRLLEFSIRAYRALLFLYPEELRREFSGEMVLAFTDDLEEAWGDARIAGLAHVWWLALRELVTVAIPSQRSNPYFLSPALSFLTTAVTQSAILWFGSHVSHIGAVPEVTVMGLAVLMASSVNAVVAFVVTCFYSRCSINVLLLD
jgi:hypothetical protein